MVYCYDHVSALPRREQEVIRTYGWATFIKTRFNSHLEFLRRCLHFGVVPKGLVVSKTRFNLKPGLFLGDLLPCLCIRPLDCKKSLF